MKSETLHTGGFLVSEANGCLSRDVETLITGQNLKAGTVLGFIASALTASAAAAVGNTGNGTIGAITVTTALVGAYTLTVIEPGTDAGTFEVEDPNGTSIGTGTVGAAFTAGGLSFTLADGATDFVAGDQFTITVDEGSGKVTQLDLTATNGSQNAARLLYDDVDATDADQQCVVISRQAEFNAAEIIWPDGITDNQKATALAQLKTLGLIAR